jgi:hypothetical protein
MGALPDALLASARPLLDQTNDSEEPLNRAFAISQFGSNLALLPADSRETMLGEMQYTLGMDDEAFAAFRQSIIVLMIRRHEEMSPGLHLRRFANPAPSQTSLQAHTRKVVPGERKSGTDRYASCSCDSGEKFKFYRAANGRRFPGTRPVRCNQKHDGIRTYNTACPARANGSGPREGRRPS